MGSSIVQPLTSDSLKFCIVNLTHATTLSVVCEPVELIKLKPANQFKVLLNYLQQTFYYIFSNLMHGGFFTVFFLFFFIYTASHSLAAFSVFHLSHLIEFMYFHCPSQSRTTAFLH